MIDRWISERKRILENTAATGSETQGDGETDVNPVAGDMDLLVHYSDGVILVEGE